MNRFWACVLPLIGCFLTLTPALAEPGISADSITFGQSAGLTGGQSKHSKQVILGVNSYFAAVNKTGGINGRRLLLQSVDDQGKKDNTVANTKKFVEEGNVFALLGYTSGAAVEELLPLLDTLKIPLLSPATGNVGSRTTFSRYVFHTRAGYVEEAKKAVNSLAITGVTRFAIAYLGDAGPANPKAMVDALAANKLKPVAEAALDRNALDAAPQVDALLKGNPEVVLMISNAKPITMVVNGMRAKGYKGRFVLSSFSGLGVIADLKENAAGVVMLQVLPQVTRTNLKLIKDYTQHLNDFAPQEKPDYESLEGYVAAKVAAEAIKRMGSKVTREGLIKAMESIKGFDLGGYEINFSNTDHTGSHFVDSAIVNAAGKLVF